jgi:Na+-transporting NADH:ubiquinone oxidoreductase subunit C
MNREGIFYTVIVTFVVSFVFVALLALSNEFTRELVERNRVLSERRSVLQSFGIEIERSDADYELYDNRVTESTEQGFQLYQAQVDGQTVRAIKFSGSGLWGTITGVIAVEQDLSRIIGMEIISHNETPGLGGRIDEDWFKDQFRGEKIDEGRIRILGTGGGDTDKDNGRVDAVTGATRTSTALEQIVNASLETLVRLRGNQ